MKGALIGLLISIILLFSLSFKMSTHRTKPTIDIHFHDTYFILSYTSVVIFLILFLGTFFTFGGTIGTNFKNKLFWVLALAFLGVDIFFIVRNYKLFL